MARLAFGPARVWRSNDKPLLRQTVTAAAAAHKPLHLGRSLGEAIDNLFAALEMEHGRVLTSVTFGLLTASQGGLSRVELLVSIAM